MRGSVRDEAAVGTERDRDEERRPLREAFMNDVYRLMDQKKISQREMAAALGWSSHTVMNRWRHLMKEPDPEQVFELEEYLGVAPGGLSRRLGYLPLSAAKLPTGDLEKMITNDPVLPDWGKEILLVSYREIMRSLGRGRRR
jgi:transcriptional regulator with XRE-family HTH domain